MPQRVLRRPQPSSSLFDPFIAHLTVAMRQINERAIQQALTDLQDGRFPSVRAAAKAYDLVESTLRRRRHGQTPQNLRCCCHLFRRAWYETGSYTVMSVGTLFPMHSCASSWYYHRPRQVLYVFKRRGWSPILRGRRISSASTIK